MLNSATADITQGKVLYVARLRADSLYFDPSGGNVPPVQMTAVQ